MSDEERRALLEAVAAGEISPEEAARRLGSGDDASAPADGATTTSEATEARRLRVDATGAALRIIGDPDISGVLVDGEHEIEELDDATVVIRCHPLRNLVGAGAFSGGGGFRIHGAGSHRRIDFGSVAAGIRTTIRMNPHLPLAIDLNAGSVNARGVHGPIDVDVDAGAAHLRDVRGPITAAVNAGALTVEGKLDAGESSITCDMGATTVRLAPDSDVRVRAAVDLGRCEIRLPHDSGHSGDYVLGSGTASLRIKGSMSSVTVTGER
jgi:hypothetical protein